MFGVCVWMFRYGMSEILWCEFDDKKNNDFDRDVYFVNFVLCESIDFTGVLSDFWVVNKLVLKCYFFIKYGVFGWVRGNALFSRVWWDFWVICGDFWRGRNG